MGGSVAAKYTKNNLRGEYGMRRNHHGIICLISSNELAILI